MCKTGRQAERSCNSNSTADLGSTHGLVLLTDESWRLLSSGYIGSNCMKTCALCKLDL